MAHKLTSAKLQAAIGIPPSRPSPLIPSFDTLPDGGFIRESQLVQSPKRPNSPAPLPFSAPTLWRKVKNGTWPRPIRLSTRVSAWVVGECRAVNAARIAGKSDAEIRNLVNDLHAKRLGHGQR